MTPNIIQPATNAATSHVQQLGRLLCLRPLSAPFPLKAEHQKQPQNRCGGIRDVKTAAILLVIHNIHIHNGFSLAPSCLRLLCPDVPPAPPGSAHLIL